MSGMKIYGRIDDSLLQVSVEGGYQPDVFEDILTRMIDSLQRMYLTQQTEADATTTE